MTQEPKLREKVEEALNKHMEAVWVLSPDEKGEALTDFVLSLLLSDRAETIRVLREVVKGYAEILPSPSMLESFDKEAEEILKQ